MNPITFKALLSTGIIHAAGVEAPVVTDDFAAEVDVEVFKRHREEVGVMDFSQRFWRGNR